MVQSVDTWGVQGSLLLLKLIVLLALATGLGAIAPAHGQDRILHVAWSLQAPYQFLQSASESDYVTGIDVATFRQVAARMGFSVAMREVPWEQALEEVATGEVDAVLAAFRTADRERSGHFSVPLRISREKLFLPPGLHPEAATPEALLEAVGQAELRIGVVEGYELGRTFREFKELHPERVSEWPSLNELFSALKADRIDGFILDRFSGYRALDHHRLWRFEPHATAVFEAPLGVLFSRKTVEPDLVQRFDSTLAQLHAEGETRAIQRRFVLPVMLDIALYGAWFEAILIIGMIAFSISAVVIARNGGYSLYGALVLASLPAMGGGVVRDVLILREPYIFESPVYVQIVLCTLIVGYLFNRLLDLLRGRSLLFFDLVHFTLMLRQRIKPQLLLQVFDAAGMAAYSIAAIAVAVEFGRDPLWLWGPMLAVLTATGGAILRDMIRPDGANDIMRNASWGETVVLWCLPLSLYLQYFGHSAAPETLFWALMISMGGIFVTRMAFITFDWRAPRY